MSSLITAISHVPYRVKDLDESIEFYTKLLGFQLVRRWKMDGRESAYLGLGGVLLEMSGGGNAADFPDGRPGGRRLGLAVSDLDAVIADLTGKGVKIGYEPYEARTFWGRQGGIVEPSGFVISLRQWREPDNPSFEGWQPNSEGVERTG